MTIYTVSYGEYRRTIMSCNFWDPPIENRFLCPGHKIVPRAHCAPHFDRQESTVTCACAGLGFEQLSAGMCTSLHARASAAKNHGQAHVQAWREAARGPRTFDILIYEQRPGTSDLDLGRETWGKEPPFPRFPGPRLTNFPQCTGT